MGGGLTLRIFLRSKWLTFGLVHLQNCPWWLEMTLSPTLQFSKIKFLCEPSPSDKQVLFLFFLCLSWNINFTKIQLYQIFPHYKFSDNEINFYYREDFHHSIIAIDFLLMKIRYFLFWKRPKITQFFFWGIYA